VLIAYLCITKLRKCLALNAEKKKYGRSFQTIAEMKEYVRMYNEVVNESENEINKKDNIYKLEYNICPEYRNGKMYYIRYVIMERNIDLGKKTSRWYDNETEIEKMKIDIEKDKEEFEKRYNNLQKKFSSEAISTIEDMYTRKYMCINCKKNVSIEDTHHYIISGSGSMPLYYAVCCKCNAKEKLLIGLLVGIAIISVIVVIVMQLIG